MKLVAALLAMIIATGASLAAVEPPPQDERDRITRYHAYHVLVRSDAEARERVDAW